jgi:hypothetical protein
MKNLPRLLVLFSVAAGTALLAQDYAPAPTVTANPPPSSSAAAPSSTPVDGLIHVQKLPTSAQLTADAEAEGMTVTRMEQYSDRIIVTYRYASGNTRTFAYTTALPENPETTTSSTTRVVTTVPAPAPNYTVIYSEPAPVYYYPRYYSSYDPYWPRTSLSIGLGFGRGFGGYYGPSRYYGSHGHWRH